MACPRPDTVVEFIVHGHGNEVNVTSIKDSFSRFIFVMR